MEIALREQLDYLDMIFIVESTVNQKGVGKYFPIQYLSCIYQYYLFQKPKPLLWERLKFSDRFSFVNLSKVCHVVMDEGLLDPELVKEDRW